VDLERMKDAYADRANFLIVYVREAHACDEWEMEDNTRAGVRLEQPGSDPERRAAAAKFVSGVGTTIPVLVDGVDDAVGIPWGAWPERLYVLDAGGRVLYRGGPGPFEFRPEEVEALLRSMPPETRF
jgi:hypothetical protein